MLICDFKMYSSDLPYITSPEIYENGNTNSFHSKGLYSEVIFGSRTPYRCQCGSLTNKSHQGEECDICGVTCDDGSKRAKQFGKIKLPIKVLLPIFFPAVKDIFGIKAIKDIFSRSKRTKNLTDPFFFDLTNKSLRRKKSLKENSDIIEKFPVYDISSLSRLFHYMTINPSYVNIIEEYCPPLQFDFVFTDEVLVIPPLTRPIVMTGQKQDIPDLSKFYKKLLQLSTSTFWDSIDKEEFMDGIEVDDTEETIDGIEVDDTLDTEKVQENKSVLKETGKRKEEFDIMAYNFQKVLNEMYEYVFKSSFTEKKSVLKNSVNGSTVEYSARCTIIPEPALPLNSIGLDFESVSKIVMPQFIRYLNLAIEDGINLSEKTGDKFLATKIYDIIHYTTATKDIFDLVDKKLFIDFLKKLEKDIIVIIERAPVLWRFNVLGYSIRNVLLETDGYEEFDDSNWKGPELSKTTMYQNKVMQTQTTWSAAFNLDYDGDTMSIYSVHSKQALRNIHDFKFANIKNQRFEHTNKLIISPEHEAIYSFWALTDACKDFDLTKFSQNELDNAEIFNILTDKVDFKIMNDNPNKLVICEHLNERYYLPYNIAAINKAYGLIVLNQNPGRMDKKAIMKLLDKINDAVSQELFINGGVFFEGNKFFLMCSTVVGYCNPTFDLKDFAIGSETISDYKNTLINEPFIGFHQNDILFTDYVKPEIAKDPKNSLYRVSESNARIKSVQLLKAASNNGIPTDINGRAFINNIKEDLLTGHTKSGFFQSGDSARLALAQRQEAIPRGGELQRRFYWITGMLKLSRTDDCGSHRTLPIYIRDKDHLKTLDGRWFTTEDKVEKKHNRIVNNNLVKVDINDNSSEDLIGKTVNFRSPIFCEQPGYKICDKCFGIHQPKSVNLGAAIGSYIPEAIIQSVLRTHHFSGAFITKIQKDIVELIKRNRFESPNIVYFKDKRDYNKLREFYNKVYPNSEDIEINRNESLDTETEMAYEINVIEPPFNDDSVKQLNKIIQIIDKDRDNASLMPLTEMYDNLLDEIILPNGIFSIYIELIMSLMFYDEEDILIRYGGDPYHQVALKKVISKCDPRLAIFYNLNQRAVAQILRDGNNKSLGAEHMLSNIITIYEK